MSQTMRRRKLLTPFIIAAVLLCLPVIAAVSFFLPQYHTFTALGEIVPMREIGVNGSVHFVYVQEGVTTNFFEQIVIIRNYPDAQFSPADKNSKRHFDAYIDFEEEARNDTILHALQSASELTDSGQAEDQWRDRLALLIEETSDLYGDSIGLMLGIGLIEEATGEDFSRGGNIVIAGTGTLEEDHTVGSVGGIRNKLRTAEKYEADIFFVPHDIHTYEYEGLSNEEEAAQVVQELGLQLQVVPVSSLEEAVAYLRSLQ